MIIKLLFALLLLGFSIVLNNVLLRFSKTLGIRNHDLSIVRWSASSKPALGGISFFVIFLISIASAGFLVQTHLYNARLLGVIGACCLGFIMGLADDAYNTRPLLKFLVQVSCALILIFTGTMISFFDTAWLNYLITIVWVVGIMNSVNMLDNMDAVTTSVSIAILLGIVVLLIFNNNTDSVLFYVLLGNLAALVGFLFFNWYPSKMFMGDTGSQYLGALLAAVGIIFYWNANDNTVAINNQWIRLVVPLLAFAVPIIDTTTVVVNRLLKKQSPFVGGKDHTTHHLFYIGLTERRIAILLFSISLASVAMIVWFLNNYELTINTFKYLAYISFIFFFLLLYVPTVIVKRNNNK
ncbi:MAG: undecaprenyl/decaprenyl-phosphate alpha-N-acetylglucosaminyl 1-phosphate transferase [Bacteroidetes bacterium]|nr:undecaprenyl/decaprenyl-phosphate alpha-N-acetylglucosaminyl 1-phosphate transferase [Bacteroidota bacterium]